MKYYNIIVSMTVVLSFFTLQTTQADTIADWTFETTSNSITGSSTTLGGIAADIGSGTASGTHASAATYSHPAGNGSPSSFSVNTWAVNDYYQFSVSTIGFTNITLSFDQTGSGTGPRDFSLQYSSDGTTFSPFGSSFLVLSNGASANNEGLGITTAAWAATGSPQSVFNHFFDLSSLTALANDSTVSFRIVDFDTTSIGAGTVAASGTDRIDNFIVNGTAVPEPSTMALAAVGGMACLFAVRRKR